MSDTWHNLVRGFGPEARQALLAALLGPGEPPPATLLDQSLVPVMDGCAEYELEIPQWMNADGSRVKLRLKALRFRDRMLAEAAATVINPKTGKAEINPWRLMAEEVARGCEAPRITVDHVLDWNDDIVRRVHDFILKLSDYPPARVARELVRMAGGEAPEPARGGGGNALPDDAGGAAG